jgi:hypothetical protein
LFIISGRNMVKRTFFLILKYPQDPIIKRENNYLFL